MLIVLISHAISLMFAVPVLFFYCILKPKKLWKNKNILIPFLVLPIAGIIFYKFASGTDFVSVFSNVLKLITFKKGWGVFETENSLLEVYSYAGYFLALLGVIILTKTKKNRFFVLWPFIILLSMASFKYLDISYFSSYQRNMYYLALSLPFLSSVGLSGILAVMKNKIKTKKLKIISISLILVLVFLLTFYSYYSLPKETVLYQLIDEKDYRDLVYISTLPKSKIIAPSEISTAMYAVSEQKPLATIFFNSGKISALNYFFTDNCKNKEKRIKENNISYVISKNKIDCGWKLIKQDNKYVYQINNE